MAEQAYKRALELAPALTDAHLNLVTLLLQRGALVEAAAACEAAIESSPDEPNAHLKLAEVRARQRRYDDALRLLAEAQRLVPYTHPPKVLLAVYLFQSGDLERARTLLDEARAEHPQHPVPLLFLGQLARQQNELDAARRHLAAAASLPLPDNCPQSHRRRFQLLLNAERSQFEMGGTPEASSDVRGE